jgi:hypothetical protein
MRIVRSGCSGRRPFRLLAGGGDGDLGAWLGPADVRYRGFMGWEMPWYSAQGSLDTLLAGRHVGRMHIVCCLRQESNVFETYWTTSRGVEAMDNSYRLLDLTVYGRDETWEDSPAGWPQRFKGKENFRIDGRPSVRPGFAELNDRL